MKQEGMQIDTLSFQDSILRVKCSGVFGVGSEGNPSGILLRKSIENWMQSHPGVKVEQIEIDLTDVIYSWGDGPISSLIIFMTRGVSQFRFLASLQNQKPLQNLIETSKLPGFTVEGSDT
jgi:hypothetical protein